MSDTQTTESEALPDLVNPLPLPTVLHHTLPHQVQTGPYIPRHFPQASDSHRPSHAHIYVSFSPTSQITFLIMLSVASQDFHNHQHQSQAYYAHYRPMPHREEPIISSVAMSGSPTLGKPSQDAAVAQALEIARESPDGASDPTVSKILEHALNNIWGKVQAQPNSYVMTRDEFAVFNFFQHRFMGDKDAVSARRRYWDNSRA